jgi:hypothetical protein
VVKTAACMWMTTEKRKMKQQSALHDTTGSTGRVDQGSTAQPREMAWKGIKQENLEVDAGNALDRHRDSYLLVLVGWPPSWVTVIDKCGDTAS